LLTRPRRQLSSGSGNGNDDARERGDAYASDVGRPPHPLQHPHCCPQPQCSLSTPRPGASRGCGSSPGADVSGNSATARPFLVPVVRADGKQFGVGGRGVSAMAGGPTHHRDYKRSRQFLWLVDASAGPLQFQAVQKICAPSVHGQSQMHAQSLVEEERWLTWSRY